MPGKLLAAILTSCVIVACGGDHATPGARRQRDPDGSVGMRCPGRAFPIADERMRGAIPRDSVCALLGLALREIRQQPRALTGLEARDAEVVDSAWIYPTGLREEGTTREEKYIVIYLSLRRPYDADARFRRDTAEVRVRRVHQPLR